MSREVCTNWVEGDPARGCSKVLDALKSKYSCMYEPNNRTRYLTSLSVYGNREVDEPQSTSFSNLMVNPHFIDQQIIKEKITAALTVLSFREPRVLVQFWSPVFIRKRCLLTTLDQPFGLGVVDEGLYLYRLESEQRVFVVDGEHREDLGPPGRAYRQKLPEWSLDVHGLSTRQCVQDWPACYKIHGYISLPVFEPDSGCCVGVLELITSSNYVDYAFEVREVSRALKKQNLKSPIVFEDPSFYVGDERRQLELDEIFQALKMVCDIQKLPLAQTWALSGYSSVVASFGNLERSCSSFNRSCIGKVCMSTTALPFYVRDLSMWGFHEACVVRHLEKSRGVVGMSLSSRGLCFCGDVTKLDEDEYPLVPYARVSGITSCLAIYMKSLEVDSEYVIELFLPPHCKNEADLQSLVESLVKTLKQQIKNASRVQLGIMLSPQVIGGIPLNWNLESPPLTEIEDIPPESENQQPLVENEHNNVDVTFSKEGEVAYVEHMQEDILENEPLNSVAAAEGRSHSIVCLEVGVEVSDINPGKTSRKYSDNSKEPSRKKKRTDRSIDLEEIRKHYGKTVEEAADSLHVSRSTLKRICRSLGIPRWPYCRAPNESNSLLKPAQTDVIRASEGALTPVLGDSIELLNTTNRSDDPASLAKHSKRSSSLVLHQQEQTNLRGGSAAPETTITEKCIVNTAENTVKNLTIKATYRENTVRFPFCLSDGLTKLEEQVATRFQFRLGSFSLKYVDEDGDMILIACDNDLTGSLGAFTQPDIQPVIKLLVWPIAHQSPNA